MTTVYDAPQTSYSDTTPQLRVIGDSIYMIDPLDTPLLAAIGGLDGARSKFKLNANGTKIEILEDEMGPLAGAVANGTVALTTDTLSFTVADGSVFKDGDVILIGAEYMIVSGVSSDVVTVESRAYGGTNATHATNAAIEIVGTARLEGDDADYSAIVDITAPYNYTQIFQDAFKMTGTMEKLSLIGVPNPWEYQASKKVPDLLRRIEKALFHGIRAAGSATTRRSFGGLLTFITDNVTASVGAIAKADIDTMMESIYADGGNPNKLVLNQAVAGDLKALLDTSAFVNLTQENTQLGMAPVQRIVTQYGSLELLMDRFCPVGYVFALDTIKVGMYTYRPFGWHELAVTGDSRKGEVVGEFSLMVANDKAHGALTGVTS